MRTERTNMAASLAVGAAAVAAGQLLLVVLAPLSRAASEGVLADGVAFLAPDSLVYLDLAADADWLDRTPWNRLLLIALLRLGAAIGDATTLVVLLQAALLAVAAALAHDMARRHAGPGAGVIAAAVVAINPLTAQWVRFVLTETIMLSLMVIALRLAERTLRPDPGPGTVTLLLATAAAAAFLRPNGIVVLGSALTLLVLRLPSRGRAIPLVLVWGGVAAGLLLGLDAAGQPAERPLTAQLHAGVVIEGTEDVQVTIGMPAPDDPGDVSNAAGVRYVLAEPVAVTRLVASRIVVEVAQVRGHYPMAINLAIATAMLLLLSATSAGVRVGGTGTMTRAALILGIPILLLIGATFATPEARYGWAALILTAPIAGIGASRLLSAVGRRQPLTEGPEGPETAR